VVALATALALMAAACSEVTEEEMRERIGVERTADGGGEDPDDVELNGPDLGGPDFGDPDDDIEFDGPDLGGPEPSGSVVDRPEPLAAEQTAPSVTEGETVEHRPHSCPFDPGDVPGGGEVVCGEVVVPSRSDRPGVDGVVLEYARFLSDADADTWQPDPVVYLHGGPGGAVLEAAPFFGPEIVDRYIGERDVILYDQRGAGHSSPLPVCRSAWALTSAFYLGDQDHAELVDYYRGEIEECGVRIDARGDFDLSVYNSVVHAHDFADLLTALNLERANLHGTSYGSRLAQSVLRLHGDRVRAVVLSGVYPTDVQLIGSTPSAFRDALGAVFAACAAEPRCAEALPDPWVTLESVAAQLDADPASARVAVDDARTTPIRVDGDDLVNALHSALYRADTAAMIPDLLIDLADGETARLERIAPLALSDVANIGSFVSVMCKEEAPFTTLAEVDAARTGYRPADRINLPPGFVGPTLLDVCGSWAIGPPDPAENEPVVWDHPTLLFAGAFDPITPPQWARTVADRLPNATLAEFGEYGHDSDSGWCAQALSTDFMSDPTATLDTSCVVDVLPYLDDAAMRWQPAQVATQPTTVELGSGTEIDEVPVPDWWPGIDTDELAWWRAFDVIDNTALVIQPDGFDIAGLMDYFDVNAKSAWLDLSPSELDGWTRQTLGTSTVDMIVYHRNGPDPVAVALFAYPADLGAFERDLLIPAVQAFDAR